MCPRVGTFRHGVILSRGREVNRIRISKGLDFLEGYSETHNLSFAPDPVHVAESVPPLPGGRAAVTAAFV